MDAIVSRLSLALENSSSSCLTRVSKSEEGPDAVWVDGGGCGNSVS